MNKELLAQRAAGLSAALPAPHFPSELDYGVITLDSGFACPDILPDLGAIAAEALTTRRAETLQYSAKQGQRELRGWIADYMNDEGGAVTPDELMIVNGAKQGIDLIYRLLLDEGDAIVVTAPTYFNAIPIFRNFGVEFAEVAQDGDGLLVSELERLLAERGHNGKPPPKLRGHRHPVRSRRRQGRGDRLGTGGLPRLPRRRRRRSLRGGGMMRLLPMLATLALAAALLAGCGRADPRPLTVVGWGGSSQEGHRLAYWIEFSETRDVPLQEDVWHGGIGVLRTRVRGGTPSWDVVQVETEELILGCEQGLFEPLDWDALGGRAAFIPAAVHECGVGAMLWSYVIGYDGDRIEGPGPASWADFWDVEKFPGKRGMRKTPKYTLEFALMADGVAPEDVYTVLRTPAGVDRAFRKLDELKPHVIWWHSISQVPQLLASGEVSMSVTSPGRLIVANETDGTNFKLAWSGNIYAVDFWVVLKNSPRRDEAMQLVRYMTRPEQQRKLAALIPTGLTNKVAIATVDPALKIHTPSNPANMVRAVALDAAFWVENLDRLTQRFDAWATR